MTGPVKQNLCALPRDIGRCKRPVDAYYFNEAKNKCILFKYWGCGGNLNRFESIQECERQCLYENFDDDIRTNVL